MPETNVPADQQEEASPKKQGRAKRFIAFCSRTKEQYKANADKAYVQAKEYLSGPWWFQDKEPVSRFTGWVAVFTGFLVLVSFLQFCTLQSTDETTKAALVAANRAWIEPFNATVGYPFVLQKGIEVHIQYVNFGREPALSLTRGHLSEYYSLKDWNSGAAVRKINALTNFCLSQKTIPYDAANSVTYPNTSAFDLHFKTDDEANGDKLVATDAFLNHTDILTVSGCFMYRTFREVHHSAFCFYYPSDAPPNLFNMSVCNYGNAAD